jgi:hypothetical protein
VSTYPDHILRLGTQHLAELKRKAAEFERQLWDAHESLENGMAESAIATQVIADAHREAFGWPAAGAPEGADGVAPVDLLAGPGTLPLADVDPAGPLYSPDERTATIVGQGRRPAVHSRRGRNIVVAAVASAAIAALVTVLALAMSGPGPAWPASVARVERQIAVACRNPDVSSEPSQLNFACGRATRRILWVFSLMTSGNNPSFASIKTGRQGLEPITPAQGGAVAWSLNLHHPYDPANPIDSLAVAARAINNIIGGATLTAANGKPIVQPGLESLPANCARYTGSARVRSRAGFPAVCAEPITSLAGQSYLVADVFQKWVVGAPPSAAQDAAVLFQNANNPGDPRVQAILGSLQPSKLYG